ncbi:hypothetical protein JR316_0009291 [Psilocybe cubensis]|uniref:Uncharacterized protein n=1 Tax=Psilocybe cubensis TaxID=181762 RepID=A0ACB8GTP5_PSICU|nr:hypothetical protein JR316_0009291 [Psilocybe cubensis]KAH9478829.1 hypothetical protein JR316_0009291 [Psilocybe cubensis]
MLHSYFTVNGSRIFTPPVYGQTFLADKEAIQGQNPTLKPELVKQFAHLLPWLNIPNEVEKAVAERDQGYCIMSGACGQDKVAVTWIIPPAFLPIVSAVPGTGFKHYADICIPSNALTMHRDLVDDFWDNAFGVDVEPTMKPTYPSESLKHRTTIDLLYFGTSDKPESYWKASLHHSIEVKAVAGQTIYFFCLLTHFIGGDIKDQYTKDDIREWRDRMEDEDGSF